MCVHTLEWLCDTHTAPSNLRIGPTCTVRLLWGNKHPWSSRIRSQIWPGTSSSMWFFEGKIPENNIQLFKFVLEILPIQPTIQAREWHIAIKNACRNIYVTQKTRCKSIVFLKAYRLTSRKPIRVKSFRTHFWWQCVTKKTLDLQANGQYTP